VPAHSNVFPWPSHYGHFNFFEQRMRGHSRVRELLKVDEGRYRLTKNDGGVLEVFICECYSFGVAEYEETKEHLGELDVIVINSNWCGYTPALKVQCRNERVGLFDIRDFMAALNRREYWLYLEEWEEKRLKERGFL